MSRKKTGKKPNIKIVAIILVLLLVPVGYLIFGRFGFSFGGYGILRYNTDSFAPLNLSARSAPFWANKGEAIKITYDVTRKDGDVIIELRKVADQRSPLTNSRDAIWKTTVRSNINQTDIVDIPSRSYYLIYVQSHGGFKGKATVRWRPKSVDYGIHPAVLVAIVAGIMGLVFIGIGLFMQRKKYQAPNDDFNGDQL